MTVVLYIMPVTQLLLTARVTVRFPSLRRFALLTRQRSLPTFVVTENSTRRYIGTPHSSILGPFYAHMALQLISSHARPSQRKRIPLGAPKWILLVLFSVFASQLAFPPALDLFGVLSCVEEMFFLPT